MTVERWPASPVKLVVVLALVLVAIPSSGIAGVVLYKHHRGRLGTKLGESCGYSGQCAGAPCIHEADGSYCSKLCDSDADCPSPYVCEPTYSGRRHACMKGGVGTRRSR